MKQSSAVLVVILNWRQPALTIECVQTLQRSDYRPLDILVIDNGSEDDSVDQLRAALPEMPLLPLTENMGFARGCNIGLRWADKHHYTKVLLLNNDAFAAPDMVSELMKEMRDDIALLSPKIFYDHQPDKIWFAGGTMHPQLLELRNRGKNKKDQPRWQETRDVDYLLGTALLVNMGAVREVGFFDERYFMYYEDLDWSLRLRQAGLRLRVVPAAHLFHRVSVSTGGQGSPMQLFYQARSSVLFFYKFARMGSPLLIFFFRLGSMIKRCFFLLWRRDFHGLRAYLRGIYYGWKDKEKG
jgi:GT2 family glycosyltransferase